MSTIQKNWNGKQRNILSKNNNVLLHSIYNKYFVLFFSNNWIELIEKWQNNKIKCGLNIYLTKQSHIRLDTVVDCAINIMMNLNFSIVS